MIHVRRARSKITTKEQIVLAFFLGAAVSSVAYDFADYLFYKAQVGGVALTVDEQAWFFAILPSLYYMAFVLLGYLFFRFTNVGASFVLYFYGFSIVLGLLLSLSLPNVSSNVFLVTAIAGGAVSLGVLYGLKRHLR